MYLTPLKLTPAFPSIECCSGLTSVLMIMIFILQIIQILLTFSITKYVSAAAIIQSPDNDLYTHIFLSHRNRATKYPKKVLTTTAFVAGSSKIQYPMIDWSVPLTWATPRIEPASFYRFYPTQIAKTSAKFHSHAKQIYTYPAIVRIFAPWLPFVVVAGHRTAVVLRCAAPFAAYLPFHLFFYSLPLPFSMGAQQHGKRFWNKYPALFKF